MKIISQCLFYQSIREQVVKVTHFSSYYLKSRTSSNKKLGRTTCFWNPSVVKRKAVSVANVISSWRAHIPPSEQLTISDRNKWARRRDKKKAPAEATSKNKRLFSQSASVKHTETRRGIFSSREGKTQAEREHIVWPNTSITTAPSLSGLRGRPSAPVLPTTAYSCLRSRTRFHTWQREREIERESERGREREAYIFLRSGR